MNYTKIIKLGEKLVNELALADGVDTLGKWMAHYIAELIEKAEIATGENKEKYEKECFEAILKLWEHIDKVPNISTPLRSFSNAIEVCKKITNNDKFRYFPSKYQDEKNIYLLLAQKVDELSKKIVYAAFSEAISEATEQEKEWLQFDELDDVINLNKIIISFEDDAEITELNKEELLISIEEFEKILEIFKTT